MRNKFPARAIHTPPFRTRGMTGNRLFNRTPSTKEVGYGKPGNSTWTVDSTEFIIHGLPNNVNLMRAILCGGFSYFLCCPKSTFQKFAKKQKGKNQLYKSSLRSPHHQFYFGNPIDNQIYLVYIKGTQEVFPMQISKAIRQVMKEKSVSLLTMAKAIGKQRGNDISARLTNPNMSFDKAVEMLDVLGYEVVIQERKPGARRADQIVIDQKES